MRPTRDRPLWFARSVICLLGVLALSLPAQALADIVDPGDVGDVVEEVTETVDDAVVEEVTEGADDAVVEEVTEGADDAAEEVTEGAGGAAEEVTEGAGDAAEEVTDVVDDAVGGVTEGVGDAVEVVTDTSGETVGSNPLAPFDGDGGGEGGGAVEPGPPTTEPGRGTIGSPVPVGEADLLRREVDRPFWWMFRGDVLGLWVPTAQTVEGDGGPSDVDSCNNDAQLVCLGLLYGLGDFANTQTQVLSFLATTGIGVIGLIMLALGLGVAGSMALLGSRYRAAATAGRAG